VKRLVTLLSILSFVLWPTGARAANARQIWADLVPGVMTGKALVVSPDGSRVFVAAYTGSNGIEIIDYQATSGATLWTATYTINNPAPIAIGISPDASKVFVTGSGFETIAYDALTGSQLWVATRAPGLQLPAAQAVSSDGGSVFVTGTGGTVAYDTSDGTTRWLVTNSTAATAIGATPDGTKVIVTGTAVFGGGHDYRTIAYDASSGTSLWVADYQDHIKLEDHALALAVAPDGSHVFVTGCVSNAYGDPICAGLPDYATVAYDAETGVQAWATTYDGPVGGQDIAHAIGVSPDGARVYVTGNSDQLATTDYVTIAYDSATGDQAWLSAYDGPTNRLDYACCLAVSGDGRRVVVTGWSGGFGTTNWATIAYSPTGRRLWQASYRLNKLYNFPFAMGMSPNASLIFVTGQVSGPDYEWATVAYRG
jgi:DNA-binding beta-propeller fold protein YncE